MPTVPRHANRHSSRAALLLAASLLPWGAALAQEARMPVAGAVAPGASCPAHEDMFKALKVTRNRGFVRVDYQFIARNEPRWANMDADLVRKLKVRVGETFCMTRDTGSAESTATDFD